MDRDKKRSLALGILIALAILFSVVYFLWGNLINRGTIAINAEAPFTVQIGAEIFNCANTPCEIKQKTGVKDLLLTKDGYRAVVTPLDVELWSTVDLNVSFIINPSFEKVEALPTVEADAEVEYKLVYDSKSGRQKLVSTADPKEVAIIYFTTQLEKAKIFPHQNRALILDQDRKVYLVDTRFNERKIINDSNLKFINEGFWSPNGGYLLFLKKDSDFFWLFDAEKEKVIQLDLKNKFTNFVWNSYSEIIFVTSQNSDSTNLNRVSFSQEDPLNNGIQEFTFSSYNPEGNFYQELAAFSENQSLPEEIISVNNSQEIYFKSGDENFRLILRKF